MELLPLPLLRRGDARYCSSRCRLAAHRSMPPAELRSRSRWVRYDAGKRPLTVDDTPASSTNSATWSDFDTAAASAVGVGLGFVLNGDGIVCVDLDHCLDGRGRLTPWAAELLADCPDTYVDVSPSGRGLHVWGFGTVVKGRKSGNVEVYGTSRYLTVTAKRWRHSGATFAGLDDWIATLPL